MLAVHLSGKSTETKHSLHTHGPSGDVCCVRSLGITLGQNISKEKKIKGKKKGKGGRGRGGEGGLITATPPGSQLTTSSVSVVE